MNAKNLGGVESRVEFDCFANFDEEQVAELIIFLVAKRKVNTHTHTHTSHEIQPENERLEPGKGPLGKRINIYTNYQLLGFMLVFGSVFSFLRLGILL